MADIYLSPTLFLCVWSLYLRILFPTLILLFQMLGKSKSSNSTVQLKSSVCPHLQTCSKLILMPKRERCLKVLSNVQFAQQGKPVGKRLPSLTSRCCYSEFNRQLTTNFPSHSYSMLLSLPRWHDFIIYKPTSILKYSKDSKIKSTRQESSK